MYHDAPALEAMRKIEGIAKQYLDTSIVTEPTLRRFTPREPDSITLGPYHLGKGSLKNLEGVNPDLVRIVHHAIGITAQDFTVTDGVRTREEQAEYVRTGVAQTMKSKHLIQSDGFSHAVDLVPWINGRARWELLACYKIMVAMRLASFARGGLLRWGGAWVPLYKESPLLAPEKLVQAYVARKRARDKPAFIDGPHYEMV